MARAKSRAALWWRRLEMKQRLAVGVGGAAAVALVASVAVVATGSPRHTLPRHHTHGTTQPHVVASTSTVPKPHLATHLCPLTGTPAPDGKVPQRPAVGVKIGNDEASRPQSGLPDADIVYEEMAEGGITRYLAVFQCHEAPVLGPVRSVRWDDWHILQSYGHPILAFSGGIDPWDQAVAEQTWLFDANGTFYPTANAYYRTTDRVPPWNYYTSTEALWALDPKHTPPPPQFTYTSAVPPEATPASQATIDSFASDVNVVWTWNQKGDDWLRSYDTQPDVDASGAQLHAVNVVIQYVQSQPGPYDESGPDSPDVESDTAGSGTAYILRDGKVESGTWSCPQYGDITTFRFKNGKAMTFAPGNTWVEVVPEGSGYNTQLVG